MKKSLDIKGKVAILTGASGGLGQAIAKSLAAQGMLLILVGRNQDQLMTLNKSLGGQHHCVAVDLETTEGRQYLADFCRQFRNGIQLLINNAGFSRFISFADMTSVDIQKTINTNLLIPIELSRLLLPLLTTQPNTQIINIGSAFGRLAFPGFSVYSASKFGLRGFSESLRRELAGTSLRVRYFAPRAMQTDMNTTTVSAMNKALGNHTDSPESVARILVKFIINSQAPELFIGWPERLFGGVNSLCSRLVDRGLRAKQPIINRFLSGENI
ncbi:MAG: SDR family oxidoreductase [Methylophaga sp.]|nr:SDR family oxidoreductase [Methylophaga sp.]